MSGASESGDVDAWPAFVDALANLVLALVFVLMVFTIALAYISTQVVARQVEKQMKEMQKEVSARESELQGEIDRLKALLAEAQKDKKADKQAKALAVETKPLNAQSAVLSQADLVVTFDPGAIEPGAEPLAKLDELMKGKGADPQTKKFMLTAIHASGPFSQEKRLAYFRLIGLRNALIDHGVPKENIVTTTDSRANLPGLKGQVRLNVGRQE